MKLGVVLGFDAAHSLPKYDGMCCRVHGHTYKVEVVVEGMVDDDTGFVMDFYDLKKMAGEAVNELDHRYLNDIIKYPTTEAIIDYIWKRMERELANRNVRLISIRVWEGEGKWGMREA